MAARKPKAVPETQTEWAGTVPTPNSVQPFGPEGERPLEPHEKLRLRYLTGQDEDPEAPRVDPGFMHGVDPDYPDAERFKA